MRWPAALLVAVALTACPHPPPPAPRAHVRILSIDRAGAALTARLAVDPGDARLVLRAVDWALALGERDLVRGRAESLVITVPAPPSVRAGALVRLRGAVHLEGPGVSALAPFDEVARVR